MLRKGKQMSILEKERNKQLKLSKTQGDKKCKNVMGYLPGTLKNGTRKYA